MADDGKNNDTTTSLMAAVEAIVYAAEKSYGLTLSTPKASPWKSAFHGATARTNESAPGGWRTLGT
jgi:hypothetical protein